MMTMLPVTIRYTPQLVIGNLDHLPRGVGAKYLEVMQDHTGAYLAVQWRRKPICALRHFLISFADLTHPQEGTP